MIFGRAHANRRSIPRPGAYAILRDGQGRIAICVIGEHAFLPGGGVEGDESHELALIREMREETGLEVEVLGEVGRADQHVHGSRESWIKLGRYFEVSLIADRQDATEVDHVVVWWSPDRAAAELNHASQRWIAEHLERGTPGSPTQASGPSGR